MMMHLLFSNVSCNLPTISSSLCWWVPRHERNIVPFDKDNYCCAACNEAAIPPPAAASADSELLVLLEEAKHLVVQFKYGVKVDGDKNTSIDGSSCPRSVSSEL